MLNLKDGVQTFRYWTAMREQQRTHAEPSDLASLKKAARAVAPDLDSHLLSLERDGGSLIKNYWSTEQCQAARDELDRLMQAEPQCVRRYSNDSDKRLFGSATSRPSVRL